jgi:hypothetical protein
MQIQGEKIKQNAGYQLCKMFIVCIEKTKLFNYFCT